MTLSKLELLQAPLLDLNGQHMGVRVGETSNHEGYERQREAIMDRIRVRSSICSVVTQE